MARAWGVSVLPDAPGRDTGEILAAASRGELGALLVGGVDPDDLPDPAARVGGARRRRRSSSASSCGRQQSPTAPTSCFPSPLSWRRPGRSSTGRGASDRSRLRCPSCRPCRTYGSCTCSPTRWTFTSGFPTSLGLAVRSAHSGPGRMRGRSSGPFPGDYGDHSSADRWCWRRGMSCSTPAGCRTTRSTSRGRHGGRLRACPSPPRRVLAATDGRWSRSAAPAGRSPCRCVVTHPWSTTPCGCRPTRAGCAVHRDLGVAAGDMVWIDAEGIEVTVNALLLAQEDLSVFGRDPWWLILLKAVGVFVILVVLTLFNDLVRAARCRAHAAADRPEPPRPAGVAAVARRRRQAGAQGRHRPEDRGHGGVLASRRSSRRRARSLPLRSSRSGRGVHLRHTSRHCS